MPFADCPNADHLRAFALGLIPEVAAAEILEHLELCDRCGEKVDSFVLTDDAIVDAIRRPVISDPLNAESGCRRVQQIAIEVGQELFRGSQGTKAGPDVDLPATTLIGNYQLVEKIGQGGMGTVYKAIHTRLSKTIALKILSKFRTKDPQAVARFAREFRAVGMIDHPHIVRGTDAGEVDGTYYRLWSAAEAILNT